MLAAWPGLIKIVTFSIVSPSPKSPMATHVSRNPVAEYSHHDTAPDWAVLTHAARTAFQQLSRVFHSPKLWNDGAANNTRNKLRTTLSTGTNDTPQSPSFIFLLPPELLIYLAHFVNASFADTKALSLTCNVFAIVTRELLFESITLVFTQKRPLNVPVPDPLHKLNIMLNSGAHLLHYARKLKVVHELHDSRELKKETTMAKMVATILPRMTNLRTADIDVDFRSPLLPILFKNLPVDLDFLILHVSPITGAGLVDISGPPISITQLHLSQFHSFRHGLTTADSQHTSQNAATLLRRFQASLTNVSFYGEMGPMILDLVDNPLPKLVSLTYFGTIGDELIKVLQVHPSITTLRISGHPDLVVPASRSPCEPFLPNLSFLHASLKTIGSFAPGRPVSVIGSFYLEGTSAEVIGAELMKLRGVDALKGAVLGLFNPTTLPEVVPYIAENLTALEKVRFIVELSVSRVSFFHIKVTSELTFNLQLIPSPRMAQYLKHLKPLMRTTLRSIRFSVGRLHTPLGPDSSDVSDDFWIRQMLEMGKEIENLEKEMGFVPSVGSGMRELGCTYRSRNYRAIRTGYGSENDHSSRWPTWDIITESV